MDERQPHAVLDLSSRHWKAQKIERLLSLDEGTERVRLLEIGAGSGGISHYFGAHASGRFDVHAVDVVDIRQIKEGYVFTRLSGTALPFEDGSFDVVISNHVIEHVGDDAAQAHHLSELHRVLRNDGVGYLAVPNRWMIVEPHYRIAFLSWWPVAWRSSWLRLWGRGSFYDCRPLARFALEQKLQAAGFCFTQFHGKALKLTFDLERPKAPIYRYFLRHIPDSVYAWAAGLFPTLIYRLSHK